MKSAIYLIEAAVNALCAAMLILAYLRSRTGLLLWSGLCFAGLAIAGSLAFVDLVLFPSVDLFLLRLSVSVIAMAMLLFGLIWGER